MLEKFRNSKYSGFIIALAFAMSILFQCILFHYIVYNTYSHELLQIPSFFIRLSFALFMAAISLCIRNKRWMVFVSAIFAIWSMAELIYFRSNNIFIEEYSMTMLGNMAGVWDSIWIFSKFIDWLLLLPTLLLALLIWCYKSNQRNIFSAILLFVLSLIINYYSCMNIHKRMECGMPVCEHQYVWNPYYKHGEASLLGFNSEDYIRNTSVIHSLVFQIKELITLPFRNEKYYLNEEDRQLVSQFINKEDSIHKPTTPIIILLIESFEAWTITPEITPNLYNFINETQSILYANKMTPQVRHGVSADGQMILNTGLLPITDGATCFRYPNNKYPAISKLYDKSGLIAALSLAYWNQKFMSDSYGIKKNYVVTSWHDEEIFKKVLDVHADHDFLLSLTMTMHAPFNECPEQEYAYIEGMPNDVFRYLNCVKYMDKQLGSLISYLTTNSMTKNSTIIITADHNVLSTESRFAFDQFNKEHNLGFGEVNGYIPFIMYSPQIHNKILIDEPVYQMDVYPTLLDVLESEDYYWRGFGVSLLKENSWKNRPISPLEAQILSDKLIRANFFEVN